MSFGWTGNILRIDLSNGKVSTAPSEPYISSFIGGRGISVKMLYDEVTNYVTNYYQKAVEKENRNVALALLILQRRLASSVRAIRRSLERRRQRLEEMYQEGVLIKEGEIFIPKDIEDLPEDERWKYEERIEKLTLAENLDELKIELDELVHDLLS